MQTFATSSTLAVKIRLKKLKKTQKLYLPCYQMQWKEPFSKNYFGKKKFFEKVKIVWSKMMKISLFFYIFIWKLIIANCDYFVMIVTSKIKWSRDGKGNYLNSTLFWNDDYSSLFRYNVLKLQVEFLIWHNMDSVNSY